MNRRLAIVSVFVLLCFGAAAVAQRGGGAPEKTETLRGAWTPPEEDRSAYRDIVDYNIFSPDRAAIARRVDQERNPPEPEAERPVVREPETPADPDASWLLVGLSHDRGGHVAYIENTKSGEMVRLQGAGAFSKGQVTAIGYDAVVYKIDDEQRIIGIGQNFVGVSAQPRAASGGSSDSGKRSSGSGSLQDRLRALREQRARELGQEPSAEPEPEPETASPAGAALEEDGGAAESKPTTETKPAGESTPANPGEGTTATFTTPSTREP